MSHTHFTIAKRYKLEAYLDDGCSIEEVDQKLGFYRGTCRREIKRNCATRDEIGPRGIIIPGRLGTVAIPQNKWLYSAEFADYKAKTRRYKANQSHHKLYDGLPLTDYIIKKIKERWSPEQISGRLRVVGASINNVRQKVIVAVQTIYDFIYERHKELKKYLRHYRGYSHNREYYINKKKRERLQAKKGIDNRPKEVDHRKRIGHWEGDTIVGGKHGATGRIGTLTERKSGYLEAFKINALTTAEKQLDESEREVLRITTSLKFADGCVGRLSRNIHPKYLKTLTLDNGSENMAYEWIERGIEGLTVFFAHPYHSWERGTNENTNGLLRQYFPKGMDFTKVTQENIDKAVEEINNRPRKRLNWRTPKEVMSRNHACCNLR